MRTLLIDNAREEPSRRAPTRDHGCAHAHVRRLDYAVGTESAFERLFAASRYAFWLDSSRVEAGMSRWSFLGDTGTTGGEVLRAEVAAGHVEVLDGDGRAVRRLPGSIFEVLDARLARRAAPMAATSTELPFDLPGGYVGYFGYEMKAECSSANTHRSPYPDAQWIAARRLLAVDHETQTTWVVALCDKDPVSCASARSWVARTAGELPPGGSAAGDNGSAGHGAGPSTDEPAVDPEPWLDRSREQYLANIAECHRALRAGESYEICLTTTLAVPFLGSALEVYLRLRRVNPAPYAAYLRFDDLEVLCSSPERFLKIGTDRTVESKPIKGTAPRSLDPARDRALAGELAESAKARAENLMITDLMRNDLGRVCEVGTVTVPTFMAVESYATVHQLVSTVRGRLRDDVSAVSAVRACFPGGSMTGAPKERTMEIIDQLEVGPRGVYSGTLGFFGPSGAADLNIVIRTAVVRSGRLSIGAGGAIVLGSDAAEEFAEMLLKVRAPLRAIRPAEVCAPARHVIRCGEPT